MFGKGHIEDMVLHYQVSGVRILPAHVSENMKQGDKLLSNDTVLERTYYC